MTTQHRDLLTETGFEELSERQLATPFIRQAVPKATDHTVAAMGALFADHDREALRDRGAAIRDEVIADLETHLVDLVAACEAKGVVVHRATDAAHAREIVRGIVRAADARTVVKSKSMMSEEIELNPALEADGVKVVETDLGEYVVQVSGDRPSHIIAPVIHLPREKVRESLSAVAGEQLPPEAEALTAWAREELRGSFLAAEVGITGVNFGVAETGTLVLVTNEGNARMTTSLPRVHVALMGIERVLPRMEDLAVMLPLLTGHGTGQQISCYVTMIDGPRREDEPDGPEEQHLVLIDNGRSALARSEYADILRCIRCGACQNICPVYRQVGGHAYGWVYGGPIGAVLTPLLRGDEDGGELAQASSLCAACDDICPVKIPLHELLVKLRRRRAEGDSAPRVEKIAFALWSRAWSVPWVYRLSGPLGRLTLLPLARGGRVRRAPRPLARWTSGRSLPLPARRPFHRR
ncbi:MAG: L-lactate dehydrogenase complex protein LldF [Solirubrobacteraceae bacterium]|jgi:L-lactate dehydrogenase complex protein LldF|nr:L-lactate dehydrogenase complex protein LldF [Solirubrobacteraceae bacterium]